MRVLLLSQFYPPVVGGEERHVRNLGAALAARGHRVSVATQAGQEPAGCTMDGAVRVHRLRGTLQRVGALFSEVERPHAPPLPDPELVLGLRRIVAEERPEIIHAHNWLLHSFLPLKSFARAPFVVTLHDYSLVCARKNFMHKGKPCSGPAFAKCLRCAIEHYHGIKGSITALSNWGNGALERRVVDKFLAVSGAVAKFNNLAGTGVPFEIVPNFVPDDINELSPNPGPLLAQLPDRFILYVGDLSWQKGIGLLLDAYRQMPTEVPLVLIGRRYPEIPSDLPLGVQVFSAWPHTAVMHAWSRCLFGVAPSIWHEPCATVVMEAMAQGKPMVVTNMGGMPDLVEHGETGFVVAPEARPLAAALTRLLDDSLLRQRMGAASRVKVVNFQASAVVSCIEDVYRDLINQRAPGAKVA